VASIEFSYDSSYVTLSRRGALVARKYKGQWQVKTAFLECIYIKQLRREVLICIFFRYKLQNYPEIHMSNSSFMQKCGMGH
jgi:hypothetical protein